MQVWYVADRVSSVGYLLPPNEMTTNRFRGGWDDFKRASDEMDARIANVNNHAASEIADAEVLAHAAWIRTLMGKLN